MFDQRLSHNCMPSVHSKKVNRHKSMSISRLDEKFGSDQWKGSISVLQTTIMTKLVRNVVMCYRKMCYVLLLNVAMCCY